MHKLYKVKCKVKYIMIFYALIIFLLIVLLYYNAVENFRDKPIYKYKDIEFKTGDIFFTHCDYITLVEPFHFLLLNLMNCVFNGGLETHVGIIVNYYGKPMIYQVEYKPTYDEFSNTWKWKSPVLMEPEKYFMEYCGEIIYYPIKNELSLDKTMEFIKTHENTEFTINQIRWINTYVKLPLDGFFNEDPPKRFCVQLTSEFLNEMELLRTSYEEAYMSFQDLKSDMEASNHWDSPVILENIYTKEIAKIKN